LNPVEPVPSGSAAPSAVPLPLATRIRAYRRLLLIALAVFAFDQATKWAVVATVPFDPMHSHGIGRDIPVIRGFCYIIHVGNTGAAWSMFSGRSVALALLAVGTLLSIYFWRHSLGLKQGITQVCFGLLCGGIVGNLVDRLVHHHVIDFLDLHFGNYIYPTFNVADSGICIGVLLYLWQSLRTPGLPEPKK
jgi:signal peptidase II